MSKTLRMVITIREASKTGKLYDAILPMLTGNLKSISAISRSLKDAGEDSHRLILTGYLRAMRDLGVLKEVDMPPSKLYTYEGGVIKGDLYSLLADKVKNISEDIQAPSAIMIINTLLERPCFEHELREIGVKPRKSEYIKRVRTSELNIHRKNITRIDIPKDDSAYEINTDKVGKELLQETVNLLQSMLQEIIDLNELSPSHQTKITDMK